MSNVTLHIGGRDYTVSCRDGEEAHLTGLGRTIAEKVEELGGAAHNEARQLLFAALMLADEAHELRKRGGGAAPAPAQSSLDPARIEAIADRLENCASALEG